MNEELTKHQKLNECYFKYVGFLNLLAESKEKSRETSRFNEREILSRFRESLRIGSSIEILKYVQKYLEELPEDLSDFEKSKIEESYLLLAGLFGLYPKQTWNSKDKYSNLGKSFYEYELKVNKGKKRSKDDLSTTGTEKRFMVLLRSSEEDLPEYLKQSIQLLSSQDIAINWLQLLKDIKNWSNEKVNVQRNWAKGFWGNSTENTEKGEEKQ
jgi:CRISPR type I-E-associated protein CasB/Cse2